MTEWIPATEAEAAMRDALRFSDQEQYFRILLATDLYLPVSVDALAGRAPMGWGTWSSGGRTHVLAFTSPESMRVCLAEHAGSARKIEYVELAKTWPNHEWWLAVNPGLPIEGYLPPWFVSQLARGDVRLPGRTIARARASGSAAAAAAAGSARASAERAARKSAPASATASASEAGPARATDFAPAAGFAPATGFAPVAGSAFAAGSASAVASAFAAGSASAVASAFAAGSASATGSAPTTGFARMAASHMKASTSVATSVIEDAEVIEPIRPQDARRGSVSRTPDGRPDRRPRRRETAIIDAEIIESTVLGPTALEATVVSATVIDDVVIDDDAIDATVVDTATEAPAEPRRAKRAHGKPVAAPAEPARPTKPAPFVPANEVEENLLDAALSGKTDNFLSTLLLAKVLIPIPTGESPDVRPDNPAFPWRREVVDGQQYVVVFTSTERMAEFMGADVVTVTAKFLQLIRNWPDVEWAFAVNPGSPVGATLPGAQIKALAVWAEDVGLTDDELEPEITEAPAPPPPTTIVMQKPIAASQVSYYLERGYDRVSGFVHRAVEVAHLRTPDQIYAGLGLSYSGSPFRRDAEEIFVLRWAAHRGDLYRIPYGGQHEAAMRAMQGWMIERAPFRGNGFAPAERGEVIAEFKVDSIRLPHGAQMWRLNAAGETALVAVLDADECQWRSARDAGVGADWDPTAAPRRNRAAIARYAAPAARAPEPAEVTDDPLDPRWRPAQAGGR